jgi:ribosomal protein S8
MPNYIISDFISRLNIAKKNKLKTIILAPSKVVLELLKIFEDLGIIRGYLVTENYKVEVMLRYNRSRCAFQHLTVMSTPGKRIYVDLLNLHKYKEKYCSDVLLLSTSKGLMLDVDCQKYKQGGLLLLRISV